ncbi:MAG: hypothetical protein WBN96_05420, partial [Gammaproteobacteria bacterium]
MGFLKGHANLLNLVLRLIDLSTVGLSGIVAYFFSNAYTTFTAAGEQGVPHSYVTVILLAIVFVTLVFPLFSVYRVWRGASTLTEIKHLTMAWAMVALTLAFLAFITRTGADYSRSWMGIWFASGWIALVGSRVILRLVLRWLRSSGFNHRHIVIVGTGEQAVVVADRLRKSTWFGLEISAMFRSGDHQLPEWLSGKTIITELADLRSYLDQNDVDQVWISLPHSEEETIRRVIGALDGSAVEIRYVPDIFEYQLMHHALSEMA